MKYAAAIMVLLSLSVVYSQVHPDTLLKKSRYYLRRDLDSSIYYLEKVKKIASESKSDSLATSYQMNMGNVMYYKGSYDSAIFFWKQALGYQGNNYEAFHSFASNNIGIIYSFQRKNDSAAIYLQKAVRLKEKLKDPSIGNTYNNLGEVSLNLGFNEKAKEYFELGLRKKLENGYEDAVGNSYLNIGRAFNRLRKLDSAIWYAKRALVAFEKFNDTKGMADALNNVGNYFVAEAPDSAELYLEKSLAIKRRRNDLSGILAGELSLAKLALHLKKWSKAEGHIQTARPLAEKLKMPKAMAELLGFGAIIDSVNADYIAALGKRSRMQVLLDSVYDSDMAATVKELEARFEAEKKEGEIMLLSQRARTQELELENRRQFQFFLLVLLFTLTVAAIFIVVTQRQKSKLKEEALQSEINELRAEIRSQSVIQRQVLDRPLEDLNRELHNPLSDREYDILQSIFTDMTNREIAEQLFISVNTVKFHLKNIYVKLGVSDRKEALLKLN